MARATLAARFVLVTAGVALALQIASDNRARATAPATAQAPAADARMNWWREARFGMFIHWGLYAIPAGEWKGRTDYGEWIRNNARIPIDEYDGFRSRFSPTRFDPSVWVRLAKQAGMKYIVITTKHHDGFCLFDSKETDFDVMSTPFGRDIMRALALACAREGIRVGWYYSIMDWHHPDYLPRRDWENRPSEGADFERYVKYMKSQIRELLSNYGRVGVLWFDGQWEGTWNNERGKDLYAYVRSLQPGIIVNNRVARASGDLDLGQARKPIGDFGTPEQEIPTTGVPGLDWETCMTMNDNWGYNRADKNFKTVEDLVRKLVDIASKGGNFLLNVGPTAEGEFPPESVERLRGIGRWMAVNGESIYATEASPFPALAWGRATRKSMTGGLTRLYLHVFDWPRDGTLVVDGILNDAMGAFLLADRARAPLAVTRKEDALLVQLPATPPDAVDSVVVLDVAGPPDVAIAPTIAAATDIFVEDLEVAVGSSRENVQVRYTTDLCDPKPTSPVAVGPVHIADTTTIRARAFRGARPVSPISAATFTKVTPRPAERPGPFERGLRFDYLEGDFKRLPDFDAAAPTRTGTIDGFNLSPRLRDTRFAFRFRGFISVPRNGAYRFYLRSDDGSRLWIGDELVVDNDGLHGSREESGVIALAAGLHPITVAMFEQSGGFELQVSYAGAGLARQAVPAAALFRPR
jgi:alpha-L-fucosidase